MEENKENVETINTVTENTAPIKEKNNKPIILVILVVLVLGLGGYVFYDKVISKPSIEGETTEPEEKTKTGETTETEEKLGYYEEIYAKYGNYEVIDGDFDDYIYLAKKEGENNYTLIYKLGLKGQAIPIGFYNNRFYYEADDQFKYIDLTASTLKEIVWLDLPQPSCKKGESGCSALSVSYAYIINDTLYFGDCAWPSAIENQSGILSISMNATKFNEFKQIVPNAFEPEFFIDDNFENIYYCDIIHENNTAYKYNISTGTVETLFSIELTDDRESLYKKIFNSNYEDSYFYKGFNKAYTDSIEYYHNDDDTDGNRGLCSLNYFGTDSQTINVTLLDGTTKTYTMTN